MEGGFLAQAFVYLCAAVLAVPVAKRLGLGSVLGYLLAGVAIGPFGLGLAGNAGEAMHVAEFGVVMMLFLVGLELQPARLWAMRGPVLGAGGLQVGLTAAAVAAIGLLFGFDWRMALAAGLILAMSSTAIALQILSERGLLKTGGGETSFAVLLFQDVAVIPILTVLPLLAAAPAAGGAAPHDGGWIETLPPWGQALAVLAAVAIVVLGGRLLTRPAFRLIAGTQLREIFTASALLLVIGIALLMETVGLSPALGAFLAGVVLADSEFRHELEGDIEPFKGLLLGLFFISVGAGIDFAQVAGAPLTVAGLVLLLVLVKAAVLAGLGRLARRPGPEILLTAMVLSQGGEFAFVLLAFSVQNGVLPQAEAGLLVSVVALSMPVTPLLMMAYGRLADRLATEDLPPEPDAIEPQGSVVLAGFGRFGQIVGRLLLAHGHQVTVLDHDMETIEQLRRFGFRVFYGDATRLDLLQAAGAAEAALVVVATDAPETTDRIVETARRHFPQAQVLARARDRPHAYDLMDAGAHLVVRETFGSALQTGVEALKRLGMPAYEAERAGRLFRRHDARMLRRLAPIRKDGADYSRAVREASEQLLLVLERDRERGRVTLDEGWDISSLAEEVRQRAVERDSAASG
ncbi:monovalent cation:proton antiporter-2 (CPA2) family protein [Paracraurococcus lichenis]|uniref:Monovalent cation:proton antiporter-2 (CPA2) family protein n=1 Tax=Paracraurococcus lichenis TaxID=3064888 RepID=A0ABT9E1N7_9PROT|nr:monovalent cation:proton antiporter-2 (CPA2) family protein [Paracraurococcus sp. LOR1-02]MDO9710076.1 monovalent cation:proton antiporter-2 (CPA2) family protein [Paracraurococcus sp. LOR1-02]